jgi:hypothetical protein
MVSERQCPPERRKEKFLNIVLIETKHESFRLNLKTH